MRHPSEETLNDLAEGLLEPVEATQVELHLRECPECAATVEGLRGLLQEAGKLAEGPVDAPDLWASIESGIRGSSRPPLDDLARRRRIRVEAGGRGHEARKAWSTPGLRAAAAVLLVAVSSGVTYLAMRPALPGVENISPAAVSPGPDSETEGVRLASNAPESMSDAYGPAIQELERILDAEKEQMDPATVAVVEEALRVIDRAIAEAAAALAADPGSAAALRSLSTTYDSKVHLLRQAAALARGA